MKQNLNPSTEEQRNRLYSFKGAGWGTSAKEWDTLKMEVLLDIKDLLVELLSAKK